MRNADSYDSILSEKIEPQVLKSVWLVKILQFSKVRDEFPR